MEDEPKNVKEILSEIKRLALENKEEEICGLVGEKDNKIFLKETKNVSRDRRRVFAIDPYEAFVFNKDVGIDIIYHTHITGPETPSDFDKAMSENSCKAFLIYSIDTGRFSITEPENKDYNTDFVSKIKKEVK